MAKIDLLTVVPFPGALPGLKNLLERFKQKYGHSAQGTFVDWNTLWREITNVGIYKSGADIAETGTTWLEGLVAMHSLRPFTPQEIDRLGGQDSFLASSWSAVTLNDRVWGIPVRSDVRILWYWKDMLEQAKLDPETAFSSFERFPETFDTLQAFVPTPWATATSVIDANSLQMLASWVWNAGGDFISADGKRVLFTEPAGRKGIHAYFDLYRYAPKQASMSEAEVGALFAARKTCATIAGPWMLPNLINRKVPTDQVGVTILPGPSFVGGTELVVYNHCSAINPILDFLEFIIEPQIQMEYCTIAGLLPTRHAAWNLSAMTSDPFYQTLYQALSKGRSYPNVPLWGVVEQKLISAIANSWSELLAQEDPNIDAIIEANFVPLARRLELSLNS